jgi:hypothetical protein
MLLERFEPPLRRTYNTLYTNLCRYFESLLGRARLVPQRFAKISFVITLPREVTLMAKIFLEGSDKCALTGLLAAVQPSNPVPDQLEAATLTLEMNLSVKRSR